MAFGPSGPLDPRTADEAVRITTGTESLLLALPRLLVGLGHEVTVYTVLPGKLASITHAGAVWRPLQEAQGTAADVALYFIASKWGETLPIQAKRRILVQTLATYAKNLMPTGTEQFFDSVLTLTEPQKENLQRNVPWFSIWEKPIPIPVDERLFEDSWGYKVPGRILYHYSPDRGLRHLLAGWAAIRQDVPEATLRVCYGADQRKDAVEPALLAQDGVTCLGTISKSQLVRELHQASLVAFPCDTFAFETQSLATAEALAADCSVLLSDQPFLKEIYPGVLSVPREPFHDFGKRFCAAMISALKEKRKTSWRWWTYENFSWARVSQQWRFLLR